MLNCGSHAECVIRTGQWGGAHINEQGGVTGGATGDQTGKEVSRCNPYHYASYPNDWDYILYPPEDGSEERNSTQDETVTVTDRADGQTGWGVTYEARTEDGWQGSVATTVSTAVIGSAGGETPEEEEAELAAHALLWDDGTLELTYVRSTASQSGGTVSMAYSVPESASSFSDIPWRSKAGFIACVIFHSSFADSGITSLAYWFYTCQKLTSVTGLGVLKVVSSLRYAFSSCISLPSQALGSMTLANSADLYKTFGGDKALTTITVDASWNLPTLSSGYQTFYNCTSLVGGNGTKYASSKAGGAYMRIDTNEQPGYLTCI